MEKQPKNKKSSSKKVFALIRALIAVILAVVLLAVSGFACFRLLTGPVEVTEGADMSAGEYVQIDVSYVMDIIGSETNANGVVVAYYAIVPVGNQFVAVRFPADQYEEFDNLRTETSNYLTGASSSMSYHIIISGQTKENITTVDRLIASWYDTNSEWMVSSGVIEEVSDGYVYLCAVTVQADRVGTMSYTAAVIVSIIAAVLVVYAIVELILILSGLYNPKAAKPTKKKAEKPVSKPVKETPAAPEAPEDAVTIAEEDTKSDA